jgi:hypothetical protein
MSAKKRKTILAQARELKLGGACKPGFPGKTAVAAALTLANAHIVDSIHPADF